MKPKAPPLQLAPRKWDRIAELLRWYDSTPSYIMDLLPDAVGECVHFEFSSALDRQLGPDWSVLGVELTTGGRMVAILMSNAEDDDVADTELRVQIKRKGTCAQRRAVV